MVERSEFELPVPVSKLSDDSILLEFSTARRIALIARKLQYYRRYDAAGGENEPLELSVPSSKRVSN
jgi:hypothetical protein